MGFTHTETTTIERNLVSAEENNMKKTLSKCVLWDKQFHRELQPYILIRDVSRYKSRYLREGKVLNGWFYFLCKITTQWERTIKVKVVVVVRV